jgi:PAS domain S-box-containing protein
MLGYTEDELRGMSCSEFANLKDSQDDWALFQQLRAGVIDHYSIEKRYVRRDGSQIWGRLNVSLSKNGDGEPPLVFAFVEEITARKSTDQELARTNERLRLALEAGKTVGWEWDIKSGRDRWCGDLKAMFGIPSDTFVGRTEDFYRYVHPEDRQLVAKAVADAISSIQIARPSDTVKVVSSSVGKSPLSSPGIPFEAQAGSGCTLRRKGSMEYKDSIVFLVLGLFLQPRMEVAV